MGELQKLRNKNLTPFRQTDQRLITSKVWSKSIIRRNSGLCKYSEIYFILNFQKYCSEFNGIKI